MTFVLSFPKAGKQSKSGCC